MAKRKQSGPRVPDVVAKAKRDKLDKNKWATMAFEYIAHDKSYQELAKIYGCSIKIISVRATEENWINLRAIYHQELCANALEKQMDFSLQNFDIRNKKHQELCAFILEQMEEELKQKTLDYKRADMYNKALSALEKGQAIERKAFGIKDTNTTENEIKIDVKMPDFSNIKVSEVDEEHIN